MAVLSDPGSLFERLMVLSHEAFDATHYSRGLYRIRVKTGHSVFMVVYLYAADNSIGPSIG